MNRYLRIVAACIALMLAALAAPAAADDRPAHAPVGALSVAADVAPSAACPADAVSAEFEDVDLGSTHARAVDCLAWWGISLGDGKYRYGPAKPVTRAQNASFLARTLDGTTRPLPAEGALALPVGIDLPDVVPGAPHAGPVVRVVASGVMRARADGSFAGADPLRRDEMAVALVAAYDHANGAPELPPLAPGRFGDLAGHPDAATIERAADLGFTSGLTATTFGPDGTVNRAQMASFLTRLLDRLVTDQFAGRPEAPAWGATPPGRRPTAAVPGEGTSYAFYEKQADGSPLRWNRCDPLPVYVNYEGAPAGAEAALERAVANLADAMGFDVHLAGTTTTTVPATGNPPMIEGQLTVAWANLGPRSLIGFGGPTWRWNGSGFGIIGGGVAMNSGWVDATTDELTLGLMHELGHAVGLDHVGDPAQVMYPSLMPGTKVAWGAGDLAGLGLLGHRSPCL